jgi:hypothetical protein
MYVLIWWGLQLAFVTFVLWYMSKMMGLLQKSVALQNESNRLLRELLSANQGDLAEGRALPASGA